jgi:hypothetical protein
MKHKFFSLRVLILICLLLILSIIYFSKILSPLQIKIEIKKHQFNRSNFHFIHEHWKEEKLKYLRNNEDFIQISEANQFKYFLKLCDWVHRQWERSVPDPYPLSNAIDILRDIRSKKTGGFCGQYAYVLADVFKSLGYFNVRYVELWSNKRRNKSHFVVEIWSDMYEKWVILDPDNNIYYEIKNTAIPANAFEIRKFIFGGEKVRLCPVTQSKPINEEEQIELYANFAVSLRSDLMRHKKPLTVNDRFQMFLFYKDQNTNQSLFEEKIPYSHITERKEDLYYDCNYVRVTYSIKSHNGETTLFFFTDGSMPNFKAFSFSRNLGETWHSLNGNFLTIKKSDLPVNILVVPINMYNRPGCTNVIDIDLKK